MKLNKFKELMAEHKKDLVEIGLMAVGSALFRPAMFRTDKYYTPSENLGTAIGCIGLGMYISDLLNE